jgi:hypothetical protein
MAEDDDPYGDGGLLVGTIVPSKLLADIGAVAVYYSHLDWQLSHAIQKLLGLKEWTGMMVTQSIASYASRVELFKGLAHRRHKEPAIRERITKLVEHLRFAGDDRNRLMHDSIFRSIRGTNFAIGTIRSNPVSRTYHEHRFDVPTIRDLQKRLNALQWIMFDFAQKDRAWLTAPLPSLDKSPTQLLRRINEEAQKQAQLQRRPKSSRRKSQSKRKPRG